MKSRVAAASGRKRRPVESADVEAARAQADAARRELADALERVSDSFVALDRDWRYTYVSRKAAQTFNRRPEDLLGRHIWTEFPEAVGLPFYQAYHRALAEQRPVYLEEYYPPLKRWFENRIHPSPEGLSIFFQDTTERRQTLSDLRDSEERLRRALEAARMGTFDWDITHNRIVWSRDHEVLFGLTPGEFGGNYEAFAQRVHPDDLPDLDARVKHCIEAREPFAHEFRILWPDGSEHWVGGRGEFTFDDDGKPARMCGVVMDVGSRRHGEEALRQTQERLEEAQAQARLGSWDLDPRKAYGTWSPEMFRLMNCDPAKGPPVFEDFLARVHPDDRATLMDVHARVLREGDPQSLDLRVAPEPGVTKHLHVLMRGRRSAAGDVVGLSGTAQDVTEHVAAHQDLEESRAELRRLTASLITAREEERARIAREIHDQCGQMLTGLKMDTAWLARHLPSREATIQAKIADMSRLVDGAVQTVREIATELRPGILDDLGLAAAIEWQAEQFGKRTGIRCDAHADVRQAGFRPNVPITVFRIFQESLTNVARHSGATIVRAVLQEDREDLVFEVLDNGRGALEEETRHTKSIGMISMRERALLVGGTFSVVGVPGVGTTVRVTIPLRDQESRG